MTANDLPIMRGGRPGLVTVVGFYQQIINYSKASLSESWRFIPTSIISIY